MAAGHSRAQLKCNLRQNKPRLTIDLQDSDVGLKFLSVFVPLFKIVYDGKYLSVRKWMIGLTLLTDNTKITTKNLGKNKFQPAFNVKVYLQTKTDKIILSRSIRGLPTPNIFFHRISIHSPALNLDLYESLEYLYRNVNEWKMRLLCDGKQFLEIQCYKVLDVTEVKNVVFIIFHLRMCLCGGWCSLLSSQIFSLIFTDPFTQWQSQRNTVSQMNFTIQKYYNFTISKNS